MGGITKVETIMAKKQKAKNSATPSLSPLGRLVQAGITGGILAAVVNLLVLFVAKFSNQGAIWILPPNAAAPINLHFFMVAILSIVPGILAALLYHVVRGRFGQKAPYIFFILATLVLILAAIPPLSSPDKISVLTLELMHLIAAVSIIYYLLGAAGSTVQKKKT
jgi:hypothetical protein